MRVLCVTHASKILSMAFGGNVLSVPIMTFVLSAIMQTNTTSDIDFSESIPSQVKGLH